MHKQRLNANADIRIEDFSVFSIASATCLSIQRYPGASVAAIALDHGLNANLLRRWVTEHERYGHHGGQDKRAVPTRKSTTVAPASMPPLLAPFVPVSVALAQGEPIRLNTRFC